MAGYVQPNFFVILSGVYKICWKGYNVVYIDETGWNIKTRIKECKKSFLNNNNNSEMSRFIIKILVLQ